MQLCVSGMPSQYSWVCWCPCPDELAADSKKEKCSKGGCQMGKFLTFEEARNRVMTHLTQSPDHGFSKEMANGAIDSHKECIEEREEEWSEEEQAPAPDAKARPPAGPPPAGPHPPMAPPPGYAVKGGQRGRSAPPSHMLHVRPVSPHSSEYERSRSRGEGRRKKVVKRRRRRSTREPSAPDTREPLPRPAKTRAPQAAADAAAAAAAHAASAAAASASQQQVQIQAPALQLDLGSSALSVVPKASACPAVTLRYGEFQMLLDSIGRAARCARSAAQIAEAASQQFRSEATALESAQAALAARMSMEQNPR